MLTAITALALAAPSAGASTRHRSPRGFQYALYAISFRGSGSYDVNGSEPPDSNTAQATFHWNVVYHPLFYSATPGAHVGTSANPMFSTGGGDWSIVNNSQNESCDEHDSLALAPQGAVVGGVGHGGALNLTVTPGFGDFTTLGGNSGPGPCDTTDFWHDWVEGFSHVGSDSNSELDPLTAFVDLSSSELRSGRETIKVSNVTLAAPSLQVPSDCGSGDGTTCTQSFSWAGTITIAKVNNTPKRHHHHHHHHRRHGRH